MKSRTFVIAHGEKWKVLLASPTDKTNAGTCDRARKTIRLDRAQLATRGVELIAHEVLHAADWSMAEDVVEDTANAIARVCQWVAEQQGGELATGKRVKR
jgi:3-deoxy-D-manno-octulosonate 8-phosphate phosphatase KdsC-like HAD superfamily phosphatase